jgi:hypothetical protein
MLTFLLLVAVQVAAAAQEVLPVVQAVVVLVVA